MERSSLFTIGHKFYRPCLFVARQTIVVFNKGLCYICSRIHGEYHAGPLPVYLHQEPVHSHWLWQNLQWFSNILHDGPQYHIPAFIIACSCVFLFAFIIGSGGLLTGLLLLFGHKFGLLCDVPDFACRVFQFFWADRNSLFSWVIPNLFYNAFWGLQIAGIKPVPVLLTVCAAVVVVKQ